MNEAKMEEILSNIDTFYNCRYTDFASFEIDNNLANNQLVFDAALIKLYSTQDDIARDEFWNELVTQKLINPY